MVIKYPLVAKKVYLARSYKIHFCLQESCKILQDKLFASTKVLNYTPKTFSVIENKLK